METREIEMYYGYYAGNVKVWDTFFINIPIDTPNELIESVAIAEAYSTIKYKWTIPVAFIGVYHIPW